VLGQLLVLWWARRNRSRFARSYAWASLAFEGLILVALILWLPFFFLAPTTVSSLVVLALWLGQIALSVYAVVLAVGAYRGRDVGATRLPRALLRLLP
jgi:hypothetical protein